MPEPAAQLELFARLPGDVLSLLDADGTVLYVTPAVERTLGYTPEEFASRSASVEIVHPDDAEELMQTWRELRADPGRESRVEVRFAHRDGRWRWVDMIMSNHLDDPEVGAVVSNFRDVTERREVEEALAASEARLQTILARGSEVYLIVDPSLTVSWASPALTSVLGFDVEQVVGQPVADYLHPEDLEVALERLAVVLGGHQVGELTVARARHADGRWRWLEIDGTDMSSDPAIGGSVITFRDITEQVTATVALADSEARFRAVVTNSRDVIATLDLAGTVTWCTQGIADMIGLSATEIVGRKAFDLVHPDDLEQSLESFALATSASEPGEGPEPVTLRLAHTAGHWVPIEIAGVSLVSDTLEVDTVVLNLRDVSWRIEAQEALRRSEERLRRLVEHSPGVIELLDADGTVGWASSSARRVFGLSPDEIVGRNASEDVHPDDRPLAVDVFLETLRNPDASARVEVRRRHADGSWRWCEVVLVNRLDDPVLSAVVAHHRDISDQVDAASALRDSEARLRALAECSPVGIFQQDADRACVYVNERWQEITGYSSEQAMGDGWRRMVHTEDRARLGMDDDPAVEVRPEDPFRLVRADGEVRWVVASTSPLVAADGAPLGTVGTLEDITERRQAERDSQRLTDIFEATQDFVGIADTTGGFLYLNRWARQFLQIGPDAPLDEVDATHVFPPDVLPMLTGEVLVELATHGVWNGELRARRPDGREVPVLGQFLVHRDPDDGSEYISGVLHDITERKDFEHQLRHQATHDPLTGLPNRTLLLDRLEHALARARRTHSPLAVLFLDLDHFKVINDSLGHSLGDRMLRELADRLLALVRPGDTVARFGGDEFVILCEDVGPHTAAITVAERIISAIGEPFVVDDSEVFVGVSMGIAISEGDHPDVSGESLIRDSDAAMYQAKERGRARWEMFDHAMRASALERLDIETALRRALERRELRCYYQPVVDVASGRVAGVEALLRWEHPERGLLLPGDFIGIAEETGLIVAVGEWVLHAACRQLQRWLADHDAATPLTLAVNLSGRQLVNPELVTQVRDVLEDTGLDPACLELEITESVLMDDVDVSRVTLGQLKDLGVRLVVDDFGTGYSSLAYLRQFPVDGLKVDRSFVDGLGRDPSDSAIVAAVVNLAHTLGLDAVAEGVETPTQLAELRDLGCDRAQGFHMARPTDASGIDALLVADRRW